LFVAEYSAQTATAIFQNESNEAFQISINQIKQHSEYTKSISVSTLRGNSPYNVKVNFENDTISAQKNIFLIDDGLTHIYNITKKSIQLKKVVPTASYQTPKNQLNVVLIINHEFLLDTLVTDTSLTDTTYIVPFSSYYKLENYDGKIGCPFPIKGPEQAELRGIILGENLEESKIEKVKIAIQDMDSACVLVSQTKELIMLFEFEETRLDFAKFMFAYTFDIDNYEKLYTAFNFENSKDELKQYVKIN
jgi:hypothetical protein